MTFQSPLPGLFAPVTVETPHHSASRNMAATQKQIAYAQSIAAKAGLPAPAALFHNSADLSAWIDRYKPKPPTGQFSQYPSSKQVAFAERIARLKRAQVPPECFKDKTLMSRWIDGNKPR
jgi:hypothetical protein